ncbi:hypothetical protein BGZ65_006848 [Modicella reniformis]|uniref:Uncharacterized protein n=1 Tax=Modicella reniformis TaxID=1440133 RepID=A0A9P6JH53_9FUNG|nr:hypothetical protein BGZ65_006848 [Modicella reniformis]
MFKDVFMHLSNKLSDLMKGRALLESVLSSVVREEFELLRDKLAALDYPNLFSAESKLRLVIDEVQILSDKIGLPDDLKIIYCGTGLSIRTLHWAMSSGGGIKEYGSSTFPYIEFPGWTRPEFAVEMLHRRMKGRFRPIVTAVESILETGDWETAINNTEIMITSWKDRHRRGNILEDKIAKHPEPFTSCSSIKESPGLFFNRHRLLDATLTMLENDVQLVEAVFGRIKLFGGSARTVLDEPLALKATENYFHVKDPSFISAAERAMMHSTNASVHGNMWEACLPPVFVETLKAQPLSSWPLLDNMSLPDQLVGEVSIVGHHEGQAKLAISHRSITTQEFMKAHVENNSKQDGQDLKLRQVLEVSDVEKALATASSRAVQEKMRKEQKKQQHQAPQLQDFCPTGSYISMVITYPAEVVKFQVVRPDPKPELEGLLRVSIGIDDRNFPKIFPRCHVEFLDTSKRPKRRSEEQEPQSSKKARASDL